MKAGVIRILAFLLCLCTVLSQFGLPVSAEEAVETQPPQEQEETAPPEREPARDVTFGRTLEIVSGFRNYDMLMDRDIYMHWAPAAWWVRPEQALTSQGTFSLGTGNRRTEQLG